MAARASDNAQPPAAPAPGTPPTVKVIIHYLGKTYDEPVPLSLVDQVITDNGLAGARIAIQDNNKSGQFLGQEYDLVEDIPPADGDVVAKANEILKDGPPSSSPILRRRICSALPTFPRPRARSSSISG